MITKMKTLICLAREETDDKNMVFINAKQITGDYVFRH